MLRVGDLVVVMSTPGIFEIVDIHGGQITIQNESGVHKVVLAQAARRLERPPAVPKA